MRARTGAIVQLVLILFFCLLLIIGLTLLTVEKRSSARDTNPWILASYADDRAHSALLGVLRQPIEVDVDGDGTTDKITIADALAANNPALDIKLSSTFESGLPTEHAWEYTITYPTRTLKGKQDVGAFEILDVTTEKGFGFTKNSGSEKIVSAKEYLRGPCVKAEVGAAGHAIKNCVEPDPGQDTGEAMITFPNGVSVTLWLGAIFGTKVAPPTGGAP